MPPRAKSILLWIVVIFVLYTVVRSPEKAAESVRSVGDFLYNAFAGFGQFFSNLAG
jgi:hypothetical protein